MGNTYKIVMVPQDDGTEVRAMEVTCSNDPTIKVLRPTSIPITRTKPVVEEVVEEDRNLSDEEVDDYLNEIIS